MGQFLDDAHDDVAERFEAYMELRDDPDATPEQIEAAKAAWRQGETDLKDILSDPVFNR
jgi:hypothetical protein